MAEAGAGPDGTLWFTDWGAGRIGVLTPDGQLDGHLVPGEGAEPHGIAVAPDGTVYAALEPGQIAKSGAHKLG
ncbi:hypothetical protein [Kitasatospora sp. NPDC005856]|uniref:virginiamycin B lyase family protein n=1 Tax=Kitasatospora sp. NPDC005856 TaxID=3154566 RepID=UPI0033E51755